MSFINAIQIYFLFLGVFRSSFPTSNDRFLTGCITCKSEKIYLRKTHVKRPHTQFACVTCSLPVKTSKYTCFYAASTSRRIHAIAANKTRKLRVTSPAGCRLTYLQFAGEFTRGVIADCLQLQVILCTIAGIFACDCAGFFCMRLQLFFPALGD